MENFVPDDKNEGTDTADGKERDGSDTEDRLFLKLLNENTETLALAVSGWGTASFVSVAAVAVAAGACCFALLKLSQTRGRRRMRGRMAQRCDYLRMKGR